ncbi:DUF6283 family protein [Bradyrhizobium sp. RT10b]|uniref:DUF6283 family protein n=1 Tax=Bradyrhizobium sp. RT10b TaxID=3156331 RepID=UPI003395F24B
MKFDLRRPCDNCPFRSDVKFPLEVERVEEIVQAITEKDLTFACHKTTRFDPETGETVRSPKEQHCAGALIMLEKMQRPNQMMRISERLGFYDRTKLEMNYVPVYENGKDMIESGAWDRGRMRVQTTTLQRSLERDKATAIKEASPPPMRRAKSAKSRWPEPARAIAQSK